MRRSTIDIFDAYRHDVILAFSGKLPWMSSLVGEGAVVGIWDR
jgi:hypothetical protein